MSLGPLGAWSYTLNGGTNVKVDTAQLTTWGWTSQSAIVITNTGNIRSNTIGTPALQFASNLSGISVSFINSVNCYIAGRGGGGGGQYGGAGAGGAGGSLGSPATPGAGRTGGGSAGAAGALTTNPQTGSYTGVGGSIIW